MATWTKNTMELKWRQRSSSSLKELLSVRKMCERLVLETSMSHYSTLRQDRAFPSFFSLQDGAKRSSTKLLGPQGWGLFDLICLQSKVAFSRLISIHVVEQVPCAVPGAKPFLIIFEASDGVWQSPSVRASVLQVSRTQASTIACWHLGQSSQCAPQTRFERTRQYLDMEVQSFHFSRCWKWNWRCRDPVFWGQLKRFKFIGRIGPNDPDALDALSSCVRWQEESDCPEAPPESDEAV